MTTTDNRPRPYSSLVNGKIVWVSPEERGAGPRKRSRPENDDEVRARLLRGAGWTVSANVTSEYLDELLKDAGLKPRGYVDVPA